MSQLRHFDALKGLSPVRNPNVRCPRLKKQTNKNKSAKIMNPKEKDPCKNHGKIDAHGFNSILKINQ